MLEQYFSTAGPWTSDSLRRAFCTGVRYCVLSLQKYSTVYATVPVEKHCYRLFEGLFQIFFLWSWFVATEKSLRKSAKEQDGRHVGFSDKNAAWLKPSASKKRPSREDSDEESVALSGSDGNEGSWDGDKDDESEVGMVDDFGASSSDDEQQVRVPCT